MEGRELLQRHVALEVALPGEIDDAHAAAHELRHGPTLPASETMRPTSNEEGPMIEPYQAIGLVPTMWGIRKREDIKRNLEHLDHLFTASIWLGGLDLPVRLVAVPEGA